MPFMNSPNSAETKQAYEREGFLVVRETQFDNNKPRSIEIKPEEQTETELNESMLWDCRKNCVNFLDAIMHKEVTWYLTGIN